MQNTPQLRRTLSLQSRNRLRFHKYRAIRKVIDALSDDLATYAAFQVLTQLAGEAADGNDAAAALKASLLFLGFDVASAKVDEDHVAKAIAKRLAFIAAKNWAEADRIRDELLAQGIQLKDGKDPVTGERITTWEVKR